MNQMSNEEIFSHIKWFFEKEDEFIWNMKYIPEPHDIKLKRYYDSSEKLFFSKLDINDSESFYYFSKNNQKTPLLTLIFNENVRKSNFRSYNGELLVFLKIKSNFSEIKKNFSLRYASKNKDSGLYYISLGEFENSNIYSKLSFLILNYSDDLFNPLLGNYKFYTIKCNEKSKKVSNNKIKSTKIRIEYNNGYVVGEGMSISGTKQHKGSFKRRNNNEGEGFTIPRRSSYKDI